MMMVQHGNAMSVLTKRRRWRFSLLFISTHEFSGGVGVTKVLGKGGVGVVKVEHRSLVSINLIALMTLN